MLDAPWTSGCGSLVPPALLADQGDEGHLFEILVIIVVPSGPGHADQMLEPVCRTDRHDQPAADGQLIVVGEGGVRRLPMPQPGASP